MNERAFWLLGEFSDADLQRRLKELLRSNSRTEARIVAHLAEVEARRLDLSVGASSLFDYCLNWLGLSNNEAFHRITAARLARKFPVIFELLERRDVHLTAVCLLRDHLTHENHEQLLHEVSHKTKRQIEHILATRFPETEGGIRPLQSMRPVSPERYRITFDASIGLKEKIEATLDLMSHANPKQDLAIAVERAFDLLLEKLQGNHFAQTKRHKAERCPAKSRPKLAHTKSVAGDTPTPPSETAAFHRRAHRRELDTSGGADELGSATPQPPRRRARVARAVVREVVARDGRQCTFIGRDGQRCSARAFLQLHHEQAWARGGAETTENLSVVCRAHNRLLAEWELGRECVEARIAEASRR